MENTRQKRVANTTQNSRKWSTWRLLCILQLCGGESVEVVVTKMVRIQFGKIVVWLTIIGECRRLYMQDFTAPLPTNNSTMIIWIIWHCRVTSGRKWEEKEETNKLLVEYCYRNPWLWCCWYPMNPDAQYSYGSRIGPFSEHCPTWMRRGLVKISSFSHSYIIQ